MKTLTVTTSMSSYPIYIKENCVEELKSFLDINRKYGIIVDENIPQNIVDIISTQLPKAYVFKSISGERAKSLSNYQHIQEFLLLNHFSRKDCIIALGGGVIGDLSGFVAATYMRGIDFINIPTTTLSQIDSSIGGKVAVNLNNTKNIIGAFYPPKLVLIDKKTLNSLNERHFNNGIVEALKSGLIYNEKLVDIIEKEDLHKEYETIVYEALLIKKKFVETDEFEKNLRKTLNFGHTIGHGFESYYNLNELLHGEAVAIGMWYAIDDETIKERLLPIYKKLSVKTSLPFESDRLFSYIRQDKKADADNISFIKLEKIGRAYVHEELLSEVRKRLEK